MKCAQQVAAADLLVEPVFEVDLAFAALWFKFGLTAKPAGG